jgi:O-methyltransferase
VNNASIGKIAKFLRKPWYGLWRQIQKYGWDEKEYILHLPFGQRIFAPWFWKESDFSKLLQPVLCAGPMAVSPDRCYILYQFCQRALNLEGDIAECGVYTGGTAHLLASIIHAKEESHHRRLHLFDTFCGMPNSSVPERDYHSPGDFSDTSLSFVQHRLKNFPFVIFHAGIMPQTFNEVASIQQYSFVHIDVDIFPSVFECCQWFWPRLSHGGALVFDDYGFYPYRYAARAAVDQFFSERKEKPLVLPTGQAVVMKL